VQKRIFLDDVFSGRRMMMKKVLITLLVLGIASVANADLMLGMDGAPISGDIDVSDVVQVMGEEPVPAQANLYVAGFGDVFVTGATLIYDYGLSEAQLGDDYAAFLGYPNKQALLDDFEAFGLTDISDILAVTFASTSVPQEPLTGLLVDGITLSGTGGTLDLIDADTFTTLQSVTVVPEPMTIALLGLGGLFLRRRK
jgi:hypothetical protein